MLSVGAISVLFISILYLIADNNKKGKEINQLRGKEQKLLTVNSDLTNANELIMHDRIKQSHIETFLVKNPEYIDEDVLERFIKTNPHLVDPVATKKAIRNNLSLLVKNSDVKDLIKEELRTNITDKMIADYLNTDAGRVSTLIDNSLKRKGIMHSWGDTVNSRIK